MIKREELACIGKITRTHGVNGEMVLLLSARWNFKSLPDCLFCSLEGLPIPFFIESLREKGADTLLVKFDTVHDLEATRRFLHAEVFVEPSLIDMDDEESVTPRMLVGYEVVDKGVLPLGTVEAVDDSTPNVLFLVRQDGRERIIPANPVWIKEIDTARHVIYYNLPDGVSEL